MTLILPGTPIPLSSLAGLDTSKTVSATGGLRAAPGAPDTLTSTVAGRLRVDRRKNAVAVERTTGRYLPSPNDRVLGTVLRSTADAYLVQLAPYATPALLPHLAFESASRKTRPILPTGSLVYARIATCATDDDDVFADTELDCVSAETGKADGLGPVGVVGVSADKAKSKDANPGAALDEYNTTGMVYGVSLGMARRLLMPRSAADGGLVVLDELEATGLTFETVVGRNGRVWVDAGGVSVDDEKSARRAVLTVVAVGRAIVETDEGCLGVDEQKKLVRRLVAGMQL